MAHLALAAVSLVLLTTNAGPAAAARDVSVVGGRVMNAAARYSFALPQGWALEERSRSETVSVSYPAAPVSCSVTSKPTDAGVATEFKGLMLALPFVGGRWTKLAERWIELDGLKAGEVTSTRAYPQHETIQLWDVVAVRKGFAYIVECSVPASEPEAGHGGLVTILESFRWE